MAQTTRKNRGSVLISGASGGIGQAAASELSALGFHVFAGVRNPGDGERLRRAISSDITPLELDITDATSIGRAVEMVSQSAKHPALAGLVNNAGIIVEGPIELVPIDEVRRQFEVNVIGHVAVTQAFLPLLRNGPGRVINIGAPTGLVAIPYLGVLSASKAALESVTDALRSELRPWNIRVSIVEPGAMQTQIFKKSSEAAIRFRRQFPPQLVQLYADSLAAMAKASASQRMESPQIVAQAIAHALTARNPRTRYLVGRGTGMFGFLRFLPDRTRDGLLLRAMGLANAQAGT